MLNRTIYHNESKVVAVTKEIEKTITPDRVTNMYDDVREEVEKSIVRSIVVNDNDLRGAAVEIEARYDTATHVVLLRFTLNGKEHIAKEVLERELQMSDQKLYERLRDFYTRIITDAVMRQTVDVIPRTLSMRSLKNV